MREESFSIAVLLAAVALAIGYALRAKRRGRARFERTDSDSVGSALTSRKAFEAGYWALQPFGNLCVALGISANAVTWMSLCFGIAAAVSVAVGHFGLGAIFALASALCDAIDGMVARKTGTSSDAGEVLDASIDRWNDFLLLAGLVFFYRDEAFVLVLALLALAGSFMVSYATAKAEALQVKAPSGAMRRPERTAYLVAGLVFSPLSIRYVEVNFTHPGRGLPIVFALAVIALVSNVSAIRRLAAVAQAVRARPSKQAVEEPLAEAAAAVDAEEEDEAAHVSIRSKAPPSLDGAE